MCISSFNALRLVLHVINKIITKRRSSCICKIKRGLPPKHPFLHVLNASQEGKGKSKGSIFLNTLYPVSNADIKLLALLFESI